MKILTKQPEFQPITIVIETQSELDQLAAMAYHCSFDDIGHGDITVKLYQSISDRVVVKYRSMDRESCQLETVND